MSQKRQVLFFFYPGRIFYNASNDRKGGICMGLLYVLAAIGAALAFIEKQPEKKEKVKRREA